MKRIACRIYQKIMKFTAYFLPWREPVLIEGEDSVLELPDILVEKGLKRILVVTDANLVRLGLLEPLLRILERDGITHTLYDKTVPNPTIANVEEALTLYKDNLAEAIVAFGGGSSIDCAKVVAARLARPKKPIAKMKGLLKIRKKTVPFFAVPTTAGTGSEATIIAVISDPEDNAKYPIIDHALMPDYAFLDPELTINLPKNHTATTGMDALTHAVEAYIGKSNTKKTAELAKEAVGLIFENLPQAFADGSESEARHQMLKASYYAGLSFTRAYVGYVHALAHSLGGFYDTPHGLANAVLLPHVLKAYGEHAKRPLAELYDAAGLKGETDSALKAKAFIAAMEKLSRSLDIPLTIKGIKEEDIPLMAERAAKEANPLYPVPRIFSAKELERFYHSVRE